MHERERHRIILDLLQSKAIATVAEIAGRTGGSEATIRRDIALLASMGRIRRVRGGAESLNQSLVNAVPARPRAVVDSINLAQKRAIAIEAARLCEDGDAVIINGGTTTFQMVFPLSTMTLQVLTNSFGIADHLLRHSRCDVFLPSGAIYRPQNIILSPFLDDGIAHFRARRMFMGAQGVSHLGLMESDPLVIQSEQRLMRQADDLVILVDSAKFNARSTMILAPLDRAAIIVTDDGVSDQARAMVEAAGVRLLVATTGASAERADTASVA